MADKNFHQMDKFRHEEDKGEDDESEEGMTNDFADYIAIEDAHDGKRQCNMGKEGNVEKGMALELLIK
jgi:hypothetical protein